MADEECQWCGRIEALLDGPLSVLVWLRLEVEEQPDADGELQAQADKVTGRNGGWHKEG